jgi:sterol desaturase/sphingolipid hydroxylase (fatty acid hydroxylase superfamily)
VLQRIDSHESACLEMWAGRLGHRRRPYTKDRVAVLLRVYLPLIFGAVAWNVYSGAGLAGSVPAFAVGLALWTLMEYLMHRFAFHGFAPHYEHHADPVDPAYILAPVWFSLGAAVVVWAAAAWVIGSGPVAAVITAGTVTGYLAYEWVHLRIHSPTAGGRLLRAWRKHHFYHHYADDRRCFGVTSPLWDLALGSAQSGSFSCVGSGSRKLDKKPSA